MISSNNSNEDIDLERPILLQLTVETVVRAYQIECFDRIDHPHTVYLTNDILIYFKDIVALYQKPESYRSASPDTDSSKRTRSNSKGPASRGYPAN